MSKKNRELEPVPQPKSMRVVTGSGKALDNLETLQCGAVRNNPYGLTRYEDSAG
jgi:hypothetical protein